jgi:hypothetical protein
MIRIKIQGLLLTFLISCTLLAPGVLIAQAPNPDWSAPLQLFNSGMSAYDPIVVTDAYDVVHVFWFEGPVAANVNGTPFNNPVAGPSVIYHTAREGGRWSKPVDIILSPGNGSAEIPEAAADPFGRLHLIWHGPNNVLYYSTADAQRASSASAWSVPKALGESLYHAGIRVDSKGNVHVVYPGLGNKGVYYLVSSDGENTWSNPTNVALTSRQDAAADYTQLAIDPTGAIHVVWTELQLPSGWPPLGVLYARSNDGGATWSAPLRLAADNYDQAMIEASKDGVIHVIWNGMVGIGGRYYEESKDGGRTWSKPVAVIPQGKGGTSGYPDFTFDSNGVLQMATPLDVDGIQYAFKQKEVWSTPQKISGDLKGKQVQSVERSRIAVSEGNRLNVVFEVGFQEIYYVSRLTDAPTVRARPLPTKVPPIPQRTATTATWTPAPTSTPTPSILGSDTSPERTDSGPWLSLLAGVIPASLLTILMLFTRIARRTV